MAVNNPDTLVVVSAYAGDVHQVEHNLPYYLHHECPVVIMSPTDAPIKACSDKRVICLNDGLKGWTGPQTLQRHLRFLKLMLKFPHEHFLFNDSDSLCLDPQLPAYLYDWPDTIWSNEVRDTNPAPSMLPKLALQPPYFMSRKSIEAMLLASKNLPTSYYGEVKSPEGWPLPFPTECIDHYVLQLACGTGLPHQSFFHGASFETDSPHGLATMLDLVRNHGRILIHSVKSPLALHHLAVANIEFRRFGPKT